MKAPDKIYLHPDFEGSQTPSVFWGIEKRGSHPEECVEYIRKDALLELLLSLEARYSVFYLQRKVIRDVIDKIDSL